MIKYLVPLRSRLRLSFLCVIEKHFTDDNNREGPDHKFSMNPSSWEEMVDRSMELWYSLGDGIKKVEENEKDTVMLQRRSLYLKKDVKAGSLLLEEDLIPVRPVQKDGLPPYKIKEVIGKMLTKDLKKDQLLRMEDLE